MRKALDPGLVVLPALLADELDVLAAAKHLCFHAVLFSGYPEELLHLRLSDGYYEPAADLQLVDERGRHLRGGRRHCDGVERGLVRRAPRAVGNAHDEVPAKEAVERLPRPVRAL